jgi:hypothetical protein
MTSIVFYAIVTSTLYIIGGVGMYRDNKFKNTNKQWMIVAQIAIGMWGIYSLLIYANTT